MLFKSGATKERTIKVKGATAATNQARDTDTCPIAPVSREKDPTVIIRPNVLFCVSFTRLYRKVSFYLKNEVESYTLLSVPSYCEIIDFYS